MSVDMDLIIHSDWSGIEDDKSVLRDFDKNVVGVDVVNIRLDNLCFLTGLINKRNGGVAVSIMDVFHIIVDNSSVSL